MPSGRSAPPGAKQLILLAVTMAVVGVAACVFFILTERGQRWDLVAFEGRKVTDLGVRRGLTRVMRLTTIPGVVIGSVAMVFVAARRGRAVAGVVAVASAGVAVTLAEILKWALPRPDLVVPPPIALHNTFPSGHSTTVVALVLSWTWLAPRCGLRPRALWCLVGLVAWLTAMIGSGWHRPSDVLGGIALATVVVTTVRLVVGMLDGATVSQPPTRVRVAAAVAVVATAGLYVMSVLNPDRNPRRSLGAYLMMVVAYTGLAALAFTLSWLETDDSRSRPTGS